MVSERKFNFRLDGFHNLSNHKPMGQLLVLQFVSFFDHIIENSTLDITKFVLWFCEFIEQ